MRPAVLADRVTPGDRKGDAASAEHATPVDSAGNHIAPPRGCTVCTDATGKRISQDCPPSCLDVLCPAIDCAPGYRLVNGPGDCCGHCEPVVDCEDIACAAMVPYCPDGQWLVKDPTQCCGWYCEPHGCNDVIACPDIALMECAPGYVMSFAPPHCCGACVPAGCDSDADCAESEYCATPACPCVQDGVNRACYADPSCHATCISDGAAF